MFTCCDTVHTNFDKVNTHLYIVHMLFTYHNTVHTHDTVHTHFDKVHTHFGTVHTLFTHYDTVHTHFDIVHTLWHSSHNVHML